MKRMLFCLLCTVCQLQALEYEVLFQNERISIVRMVVAPHEEIDAHRDAHARVVIAIQEGTITRLEQDGTTKEIVFPTGKAVFLGPDPEHEVHRSVNNTDVPMELMIINFKEEFPAVKSEPGVHDVAIDIKLTCPDSDELRDFVCSIPPAGDYSASFEEFKACFVNTMTQLIRLIESEKVGNAGWAVVTDYQACPAVSGE